MAERDVRIGLATFRRADGPDDSPVWGFALYGETVDVHKDDLERFDRLNGPALATVVPEVVVVEPGAEEPPRSGRGSGLDAWLDYAMTVGLNVPEGATRDDVIELVDARSE